EESLYSPGLLKHAVKGRRGLGVAPRGVLVHGLEVKAFDTVVLVVLGRVPRRQGKGGDDRQDEEEKGGAQSKIGFHRIRIRGPEPRPATPWPQNCEARG